MSTSSEIISTTASKHQSNPTQTSDTLNNILGTSCSKEDANRAVLQLLPDAPVDFQTVDTNVMSFGISKLAFRQKPQAPKPEVTPLIQSCKPITPRSPLLKMSEASLNS